MKKHTLYSVVFISGIVFGIPIESIKAKTDSSAMNNYILQHMKDKSFQEAKEKLNQEDFQEWAKSHYEKEQKDEKKPSAQTTTDYDDLALDPFALNL